MTEYLRWRDAFAEAMDPRFYPIEYLDAIISVNRAKMWASDKAAIVCERRVYPGGAMAIYVLHAVGDIDEIAGPLRAEAEAWARENGCETVICEGRAGWARVLNKHGYEHHLTVLRKDL